MAREQLALAFEPFNRLGLESKGIEGTGIGLAIVKKIVEYHGGRIWLDLDVESGTSINFTLPVLPGADDPTADTRAGAGPEDDDVASGNEDGTDTSDTRKEVSA